MAEASKETRVELNIRLMPVDNSDQPVLSNFTSLKGAPGMAFLDFGFLEPGAMEAVSRAARDGGKMPDTLNGKLAVRVALGFDTLMALHQQLSQVVASLQAQRPEGAATAPKDTKR